MMFDDRRFEDEYQDVLQNIEFAIINVYRQHPELTDWDALDAVEGLIRVYTAEERGRPRPDIRLNNLPQRVFEFVHAMCEWRLGREEMLTSDDQPVDMSIEPKSVDEILACLKRIRRSIRHWTKEGGRRGYLNFVAQFIQ
jgi:hypothetical protein